VQAIETALFRKTTLSWTTKVVARSLTLLQGVRIEWKGKEEGTSIYEVVIQINGRNLGKDQPSSVISELFKRCCNDKRMSHNAHCNCHIYPTD
jgi:hypothetical protein